MKAVRHFFVTGIVLIGALVSADAADTQVRLASLTYSGTSGYTLVERSNLRRSINGRYVGLTTREVRSFISPSTSPRAEYDRSTNPLSRGRWYNGSFYVLEETKRNAKESGGGIHDSIPSIFNISPEGKLTMYQDNGYPSFRSFPAFTTDKISPGDSWRATAERAVDPLNKGIFTRLRMEVSYTFVGEERYQGQNVYRIKAMWQTNYGMLSYRDLHGDDTLVKALGGHKADIYVQKSTGATVMIIDNVDETFVYSDGTNVTLRGTINLFTETPPAIDTEKIIPALQRIASVSPDVMEDALAKADSGNGDDDTAAGNDDESDNAASDADSALAKADSSSGDDDTAAGNDRESDAATTDADSALAKADSSSGDDDTAAGNDRESDSAASDADSALAKADGSSGGDETAAGNDTESGSTASDAGNALAKADGSSGDDDTAAGKGNESDSAASDADNALAKADSGSGDETAAGYDRESDSTASDAGNALAKADSSSGDDDTAAGKGNESGSTASDAGNALAKANGSSGDETAAGNDGESGNGEYGATSSIDNALASVQSAESPKNNIVVEKTNAGIRLSVRDIKFKADSAEMLPGENRRLDEIASVLKLAPESQQFLVEGHTAAVGKPNGEQRLSEQRARRIAQELEKRGVNTQSFICRGWGGTKPVASNATDAGRAQNRRVEITILQ